MQSVFAVQERRVTARQAPSCLRILFLVSAHNSLSQRIWAELTGLGHEVDVAVVDSGAQMEAAVAAHEPELIVCPILKTMIPSQVWSTHRCLVVHPGPPGDRGPSSLDWAIELGAESWGVTVLQADDEPDAGPIWASRSFQTAPGGRTRPLPPRGAAPPHPAGARAGPPSGRRRRRSAGGPTCAT